MSNKNTTDKVDKANAQMRVPKLRFPEFRDAGAWEEKPLGVIAVITSGLTQTQDSSNDGVPVTRIETISGGIVDINKVGYVEYDISMDRYKLRKEDILFSNINSVAHIGKVAIFNLNITLYHGMNLLRIQSKSNQCISDFLYFSLSSIKYKRWFERVCNKAVNQASINQTELGRTLLLLPFLPEQQKIADCLSFIDELIAAQTQKLDILKAHKKGLMQQLFPAEGETVPKLRFPEFRDAGEWEEKPIGSKCKTFSGGTPTTTQKEFYGGNIPFIRSAEIDKESTELFLTNEGLRNSAAKLVKKGDVLVALYGANSGDVAISKIDGAINQAILCLKSEDSNSFVYQFLYLKKNWIISTYIQGGQGNLSGKIIKSVRLRFPSPEEQQKIADCLASLDELIAAQVQKLDTLKAHKKGLMQQLFPSADEVNR